jgi:hypothetical protein
MPIMWDVNSMLRTADNTVSAAETENAGNAQTLDLGPGSGLNGLWIGIMNPAAVTGTTPGYTITFRTSPDKTTWSDVTNPPAVVVVAAGEYGPYRIDTTARYLSYKLARGNADNTASAVSIGVSDRVQLGPR